MVCLGRDVCSMGFKFVSMEMVDVDDNGKLVALGSQFGIIMLLWVACDLKVAW